MLSLLRLLLGYNRGYSIVTGGYIRLQVVTYIFIRLQVVTYSYIGLCAGGYLQLHRVIRRWLPTVT